MLPLVSVSFADGLCFSFGFVVVLLHVLVLCPDLVVFVYSFYIFLVVVVIVLFVKFSLACFVCWTMSLLSFVAFL